MLSQRLKERLLAIGKAAALGPLTGLDEAHVERHPDPSDVRALSAEAYALIVLSSLDARSLTEEVVGAGVRALQKDGVLVVAAPTHVSVWGRMRGQRAASLPALCGAVLRSGARDVEVESGTEWILVFANVA